VPTDATNYSSGATVTVLGNTGSLSRIGYNFIGWNTQADGLGLDRPISSTFTITSNTILYAKWQTALPVLLINYKMECEGKKVKIFWTTATEINNDYFTIEKSIDAINFFKAGIIDGAGNSNKQNNYEFFDFINSNQQYYYRLKQTDFNGNFEIFEVLSANCFTDNKINVFPTLFHDNINVKILELNVKLKIFDLDNKLIVSRTLEIENEIIDLSFLDNGIYYMQFLDNDNKLYNFKIIKL